MEPEPLPYAEFCARIAAVDMLDPFKGDSSRYDGTYNHLCVAWLEFLERRPGNRMSFLTFVKRTVELEQETLPSEYHQLNMALSSAEAYVDKPPITFAQFCSDPDMAWNYNSYCMKCRRENLGNRPVSGYMTFEEFRLKNTQ